MKSIKLPTGYFGLFPPDWNMYSVHQVLDSQLSLSLLLPLAWHTSVSIVMPCCPVHVVRGSASTGAGRRGPDTSTRTASPYNAEVVDRNDDQGLFQKVVTPFSGTILEAQRLASQIDQSVEGARTAVVEHWIVRRIWVMTIDTLNLTGVQFLLYLIFVWVFQVRVDGAPPHPTPPRIPCHWLLLTVSHPSTVARSVDARHRGVLL